MQSLQPPCRSYLPCRSGSLLNIQSPRLMRSSSSLLLFLFLCRLLELSHLLAALILGYLCNHFYFVRARLRRNLRSCFVHLILLLCILLLRPSRCFFVPLLLSNLRLVFYYRFCILLRRNLCLLETCLLASF